MGENFALLPLCQPSRQPVARCQSPTEQLVKEKRVCRTPALASHISVERVEMKYLIREIKQFSYLLLYEFPIAQEVLKLQKSKGSAKLVSVWGIMWKTTPKLILIVGQIQSLRGLEASIFLLAVN